MNVLQRISISIISTVSLTAVAFAPATVGATSVTGCTVKAVGTKNTAGASDSRFVLNADGTTTAAFVVTGTDCNEAVTIASWQAPDALKGRPYNEQKLFAQKTDTFTSGTHTLTVKLPTCFYQIDLVRGTSATDQNGGPEYDTSVMLGSLHGGTQACTTPTPPPNPTPTPTPTPPTTLPNTGTGSNIFMISAAVAVAGYAFSYIRKVRAAKTQA